MAKNLRTTPKGKAIWPRLTGTPDTKFKAEGEWKVKQELSQADGAPIVVEIDAAMQEALVEAKAKFVEAKAAYLALTPKEKSGKKPPKEPALVDAPYFVDEESGNVTLSFKLTASGVNKKTKEAFTQKPVIFDASGKVVTADIKIGGGSIIKVGYELNTFATPLGAGVSLRLKAVQVITLVAFGADAGYYGFESEDGFSAPEETEVTAAEEAGFTAEDPGTAQDTPAAGSESDDF